MNKLENATIDNETNRFITIIFNEKTLEAFSINGEPQNLRGSSLFQAIEKVEDETGYKMVGWESIIDSLNTPWWNVTKATDRIIPVVFFRKKKK